MGHVFDECSNRVIGAAVAVHSALGPGFVEGVYQAALEMELSDRGVQCSREVRVPIRYRGREVGLHRLDLIVEGRVVVELKSVSLILDTHLAQLRSYLKASGLRVGLLLNFNAAVLVIKRVVN